MRENSERPVTIKKGTNYLVGRDKNRIIKCIDNFMKGKTKSESIPALWDGRTAKRIIKIFEETL